jgi:site-specific DNA-methyltransferase (adenine-specific)
MNQILNGDCLELMKDIPNGSIDMILCDLPYGTTACKWDTVIPFDELWKQYKRIVKDNGVIVLTASQPFTSSLVMSNPDMFKYELIWEKSNPTGMIMANIRPMKYHENIAIFYSKQPTYNKQMMERTNKTVASMIKNNNNFSSSNSDSCLSGKIEYTKISAKQYEPNLKNPSSIIKINSIRPISKEYSGHPTQKPVALFEYLIKTYTNEGDLVLDNCAGSGTTAIACLNTNRQFIVMEKEQNYYDIILKRVKEWHKKNQTNIFK